MRCMSSGFMPFMLSRAMRAISGVMFMPMDPLMAAIVSGDMEDIMSLIACEPA